MQLGSSAAWPKPAPGEQARSCLASREELLEASGLESPGGRQRGANRRSAVARPRLLLSEDWDSPRGRPGVRGCLHGRASTLQGRGRAGSLLAANSDPISSACGLKPHPPTHPPEVQSHAAESSELQTAAAGEAAAAPRGCFRNSSRSPSSTLPLEFRGPSLPAPSAADLSDFREGGREGYLSPIKPTWK